MSLLIKGVTAHTLLTNKEVAGVIDHANASVTNVKAKLLGDSTTTVNLYVSNAGNDLNDGLTAATALLTLQAAINKVPDAYFFNYIINIASGTHTDYNTKIYGKHALGNVSLRLQGWQNTAANQWTHTQSVSGTGSGAGGGGNWPTAFPYLLDATKNFAAYKGGAYVLHLTGGTGYDSVSLENNWYAIATATEDAGNTHLPIVGCWQIATPDNTTTYEIIPMDACLYSNGATGVTDKYIDIRDCSNVSLRNIGFSAATAMGIYVQVSNLSNIWRWQGYSPITYPSVTNHSCWWVGIYATASASTGQMPIYISGEGDFTLLASRFVGASKLYCALIVDVGNISFSTRSVFADACSYGLYVGPCYGQITDSFFLNCITAGISLEGSWVDQSYGVYIKGSAGVGIYLATPGTKFLLAFDSIVTTSAGDGISTNYLSMVQLQAATCKSINNTGWGIKTTYNSVSFGSVAILTGNTAGTHTESAGGQFL